MTPPVSVIPDTKLLREMLITEIEREGPMASFMIRSGLLLEIIDALGSRIASQEDLVEALKPFALEAEEWSDDVPDAVIPDIVGIDGSRGLARFCIGDLRKARAALSRVKGDGE